MGLFFNKKETNFKVGKYYKANEVLEALKTRELDVDFEPIEIGSKGVSTGTFAFKAVPKRETRFNNKQERKNNKSHREWADSLVVKDIAIENSYSETGSYANLGQTHTTIKSNDEGR